MAKVFELRIVGDTSDIEDKLKQLGFAIKEVKQGTEDIGDAAEKASNRYSGSIKKSNIVVEKLNDLTGGAVNLFLDMGDAAKKAGISMRTALISTGIGALVVALGAVVAYWDEIVEFVKQTNKQLQIQIDRLERSIELRNIDIELNELVEQSLKNQGKSVDQTLKDRRAMIVEQQKELILLNSKLATQLEIEKSQEQELTFFEKILNLRQGPSGIGGGDMARARRLLEQSERIKEIEDQINENQKTILALNNTLDETVPDAPSASGRDKEVPLSFDYQSEQDKVQTYYDWYINYLKEKEAELQEVRDSAANGMNELAELSEKLTDEEIERYRKEKREKEISERGKMAITQASLDASSTAFGILGMLSEKNKELQIASIIGENATGIAKNIINTNAANARLTLETGVAAAPFIAANNIRMVTGIAASVAATVRALSELGGGGDATAGGLGTGGGGAAAPSFNLVRGTGENQILEGITRQQDPIEAYVVSDRVTSSAALNRNRASEASLG